MKPLSKRQVDLQLP